MCNDNLRFKTVQTIVSPPQFFSRVSVDGYADSINYNNYLASYNNYLNSYNNYVQQYWGYNPGYQVAPTFNSINIGPGFGSNVAVANANTGVPVFDPGFGFGGGFGYGGGFGFDPLFNGGFGGLGFDPFFGGDGFGFGTGLGGFGLTPFDNTGLGGFGFLPAFGGGGFGGGFGDGFFGSGLGPAFSGFNADPFFGGGFDSGLFGGGLDSGLFGGGGFSSPILPPVNNGPIAVAVAPPNTGFGLPWGGNPWGGNPWSGGLNKLFEAFGLFLKFLQYFGGGIDPSLYGGGRPRVAVAIAR